MGLFDKTTNESIGGGMDRPTLLGGVGHSLAEVQYSLGPSSGEIVVLGDRTVENWTSGYLDPLGGDASAEGGDTADGSEKGGVHGGSLATCLKLRAALDALVVDYARLHTERDIAEVAGDVGAIRPLNLEIALNLKKTEAIEARMVQLNCAELFKGVDIDPVGDATLPDWQL